MVAVHEALLRVEKGLVVSDSRVGPSNSQASSMNMFGRLAHEIWTGPTPGVIIPQAPVARTIDGQQSTSVTGWDFWTGLLFLATIHNIPHLECANTISNGMAASGRW
ncbi:hypothetical protein M0657_004894 [Pyricularia oryzae]|nr:hypothetical protein M9X92_004424 [Pyricularia oryzae]KAI7923884.1 hypothetical protein M0657_004894 [Pyricularia oryzae]